MQTRTWRRHNGEMKGDKKKRRGDGERGRVKVLTIIGEKTIGNKNKGEQRKRGVKGGQRSRGKGDGGIVGGDRKAGVTLPTGYSIGGEKQTWGKKKSTST